MTADRLDTGFWGWAIVWLTFAYMLGVILLGYTNGIEFMLALGATRE